MLKRSFGGAPALPRFWEAELLLWRSGWFCRFARFRRRGFTAGKVSVGRHGQYVGFSKRLWMIGKLFAQGGNLFGRYRATVVSPLTAFVSENVGNFLVGQRFVPWLHHCGPKFLAFDGDWTLQPLEHNHGRSLRTAGCKLRTSKRRILAGHAETVRLMTGLAVRGENLFPAIVRRQYGSLLTAGGTTRRGFFCWRRTTEWIKSIAAKVS